MQEIGTWTTEEGTVTAVMVLESEIPDGADAQELPGWASGALSGALGGAATGAAAGPWGALIGAAAGATIGGVSAATAAKPPSAPAPGTPPSPSPPAGVTASPPPAGAQSSAIQALQQFAAAVPALIQLVAASGAATKPMPVKKAEVTDADAADEFVSDENLAIDEWTWAAESEGAWTIP